METFSNWCGQEWEGSSSMDIKMSFPHKVCNWEAMEIIIVFAIAISPHRHIA